MYTENLAKSGYRTLFYLDSALACLHIMLKTISFADGIVTETRGDMPEGTVVLGNPRTVS